MSSILKKRPVQGQHQHGDESNDKSVGAVQQPEQSTKKVKEDENEVAEGVMQQEEPPAASSSAEIEADNNEIDDNDDDDDDDETTKDSAGEREKAKRQWLKPPQTRSPRVGAEFQADI